MPGSKARKGAAAPITVNQEILRAAGLVRRLDRPMKVLGAGGGALSAALFVVADKFSASARSAIEGAGGTVSVLEVPDARRPALGTDAEPATTKKPVADAAPDDAPAATAESDEPEPEPAEATPAKAAGAKAAGAKSAAPKAPAPKAATKAAAAKPAAKAKAAPVKAAAPAKASTTRKPRASKPDADA
jgi:hypothetical protein